MWFVCLCSGFADFGRDIGLTEVDKIDFGRLCFADCGRKFNSVDFVFAFGLPDFGLLFSSLMGSPGVIYGSEMRRFVS